MKGLNTAILDAGQTGDNPVAALRDSVSSAILHFLNNEICKMSNLFQPFYIVASVHSFKDARVVDFVAATLLLVAKWLTVLTADHGNKRWSALLARPSMSSLEAFLPKSGKVSQYDIDRRSLVIPTVKRCLGEYV